MPLLKEAYETAGETKSQSTAEQHQELVQALNDAASELIRTSCSLLDMGKVIDHDKKDGSWSTERAYHLQEGLPEGHEVAVWATFDSGSVRLCQQVVRWINTGSGLDSDDVELEKTPARVVLERQHGATSLPATPGMSPDSSHEDVMDHVWDTHETVNFLAKALGYEPRAIQY